MNKDELTIDEILELIEDEAEVPPNKYDEEGELRRDERREVVLHLQIYTNYLTVYYNYLFDSLEFKQNMRKKIYSLFRNVFYIIICSLIAGILIFIISNGFGNNEIANVISIMTLGISLISTIFIIPTKISDFVYNKEDDKNISEIIKNIQNYDTNVRMYPFTSHKSEKNNDLN